MSEPMLRLRQVGCGRGDRPLLHGIDIDLTPGMGLLLRGPNGIGKSSLLRLCAGLLRPWSGTVERQGTLALADERTALDPDLPLAKALTFWAKLDRAVPGRIDAALAAMALGPLADVPVHMLSTGQRKRATLARTLLAGADIWLLDEPANGLDDDATGLLGHALEAHRASGGITVIASHQPLPFAASATMDLRLHRAVEA